jgi:hypothetical protein
VRVETDLEVTGRQAQLGRGIMEDVAGGVLERFAEGLERELSGRGEEAAAPEEALDLGGAVLGPMRERALVFVAGLAVGVLVGGAIARR